MLNTVEDRRRVKHKNRNKENSNTYDRTAKRNKWIPYYRQRLQHPLSEIDNPSRQKISKDVVELNNTISELDIIDIYRLFHPTTV